MKKLFWAILFLIFVSACNNDEAGVSENVTIESTDQEVAISGEREQTYTDSAEADTDMTEADSANVPIDTPEVNRKVIYTAEIGVETDDFQQLSDHIHAEATRLGGYIVDSTLYNDQAEGYKNGYITVRIPQEVFHSFIEIVEEGSTKVTQHVVSGQDVTEEFVDLESRLKSKQQVEERLLEFMGNAEKTEDLLKISNDLANVQEEIETIVGRMNYLQDKTDLATVTISIQENNVKLSSVNDDELNTWGETKKQFMRSMNFIITAFSAVVVFFVGNLPVFGLLGILAVLGYLFWRKQKKK